MHGYGITVHIQQVSSEILRVEEGSLYPALHRMEQEGLISPEWQPGVNQREARGYGRHRVDRHGTEGSALRVASAAKDPGVQLYRRSGHCAGHRQHDIDVQHPEFAVIATSALPSGRPAVHGLAAPSLRRTRFLQHARFSGVETADRGLRRPGCVYRERLHHFGRGRTPVGDWTDGDAVLLSYPRRAAEGGARIHTL